MALKTDDLVLGKGELYFAKFKPGTRTPAGERYIGNSPAFIVTLAENNLKHMNSDRGIKQEDRSVSLEVTREGALTTDNIDADNLAMVLVGSKAIRTVTAATALTETFDDIEQGLFYQVGITPTNPTGARALDNVVVKVGAATKALGTDYEVDTVLGRVQPLIGGTIADAADMIVEYDLLASTRETVVSGVNVVEGQLRYVSYNIEGTRRDVVMPWVKLSPNGEFALKGDTWQDIKLKVQIQKNGNLEAIYMDGRPVITV